MPIESMNAQPPPVMKTVEEWAASKKTDAGLFAGARYRAKWAVGETVSEAAYDQAVEAMASATWGQ